MVIQTKKLIIVKACHSHTKACYQDLKQKKSLLFIFFFILILLVSPFGTTAPTPLVLSQKDVTQMVVTQSHKAQETTLKYEEMRLTPLQKLAVYDWTFSADSGYEWDHTEGPTHPSTLTNQTYKSNLKLKKGFLTGTILNFEFSRNSLYANDVDVAAPKTTQHTHDLLGFSIEQNLWKNAFGIQDRSELEAAELTYQANIMSRTSDMQELVLEALRLYWNTYVAQENFNEALSARDRYQRFVKELRQKTSYGYSNNYELFQIQAELENREQQIKTTSMDYLKNTEELKQLLNLSPETKLQFPTLEGIPDLPSLQTKNTDEISNIQSQSIKIKAAEAALTASRSQGRPLLSLNGGLYGSGFDEKPSLSENRLLSGANPKYFVGLKFIFQFGSDFSTQDILNKKTTLQIAQHRYQRVSEELKNALAHSERKVQTTFFAVSSVKKQIELREKTVREMQRSFNNGRIDISLLIEAMNKLFSSRVQYTRSVGDYFIALNEWAALNDELVIKQEGKP